MFHKMVCLMILLLLSSVLVQPSQAQLDDETTALTKKIIAMFPEKAEWDFERLSLSADLIVIGKFDSKRKLQLKNEQADMSDFDVNSQQFLVVQSPSSLSRRC